MIGTRIKRWILELAGALLAAGLAGAPALAQPLQLPAPTGPHPVGRAELHLVEAGRPDPWKPDRPRELMVSVWYPARSPEGARPAPYMPPGVARVFADALLKPVGADPSRVDFTAVVTHARVGPSARRGRHPVLLYSPGGNQVRAMGSALAVDLASRGYVVVAIDHTFEGRAVEFPDGRVEAGALPPEGGSEALRKMIEGRLGDARFVLDRLQDLQGGRGFPPALDLSRVGMFGHSAGGFTALEALGADRRIDAAANLDGSLGFSMSRRLFGRVVEAGLAKPFLLMGAGTSGPQDKPRTHAHSPDWARLWERSSGWKRDIWFPDAEHMSFADHAALLPPLVQRLGLPPALAARSIGTADPQAVVAAQRDILAAFFDLHLKGRPQPLLDAPARRHPVAERIP